MDKKWGFENYNIKIKKQNVLFILWKWLFLFIVFSLFLPFFFVTEKVVFADKKFFFDNLEKVNVLKYSYKNKIPSELLNIILDYKNWKNYIKNNPIWIKFLEDNFSLFVDLTGYGVYKNNILKIYNEFSLYFDDIYKIIWKNKIKKYLIILENTSEERPDSWFFGSFIKVSFSWWHLVDYKIYDSYYLLWKNCKTSWKDWFDKCDNKKKLSLKNNLEPYSKIYPKTTFLTSNIYWFTKLNGKKIVEHYNKIFSDKINWVIFVKSDILKYLFVNGDEKIWKMEVLNEMENWTGHYLEDNNLKGLWWKKDSYLRYINSLLKDKKFIIKNFFNNYEKIKQDWLVRFYLPEISEWFKKALKRNNFIYFKKEWFAYLFFYNTWFNKVSKFIDHIVWVNWKVFLNPKKIKLLKWKNIIKYNNSLNKDPNYNIFLDKYKIDKKSYLFSKKIDYESLLILPESCEKQSENQNVYIVNCF